jgi:hypothetical protein
VSEETKCQDERSHCWHPLVVQYAVWRELATSCSETVCCWCGHKKPLTVGYAIAQPHGPHAPKPLPQASVTAAVGVGAMGPFFGPEGIPFK